jgi:DNA polymerase III subunit gamma/tau
MDYVVLARKLRPQRFQDLVGQELTARALRNAVVTGRLAHAFLFAGSRGVGKTSTARILTKAFNCLHPDDGEPDNTCENCVEISANASPDVYEIDAASNRGIDNIRELRENTKYAPAKCRFKTYIVDEVHMLTTESFNALLKTLEEPPPHVKFILATTHPHRIPETILSRCQRFDFARIPLAKMVDYLAHATAAEGLTLSPAALAAIARNSAGGMRDALTAVDQVVSYAGAAPTDADVMGLLSLLNQGEVRALLDAILSRTLDAALESFGRIVTQGHELHSVLEALLREVKDLTLFGALVGNAGGANAYFADHLPETLEYYGARKDAVTPDELQQVFQVLLELEGQLRVSGQARACFEMALVKACQVQPLVGVPELLARARELLRGASGPGLGSGAGAALARTDAAGRAPQPRSLPPRPASTAASRPTPPALQTSAPQIPAPQNPTPPPTAPAGPSHMARAMARQSATSPSPLADQAARSGSDAAPEDSEPEPAHGGNGASPTAVESATERVPTDAATPAMSDDADAASPNEDALGDLTASESDDAVPENTVAEDTAPNDGDDPDQPAPCDDPRWEAVVQAVVAKGRKMLGGQMRNAEVRALAVDAIVVSGKASPAAKDLEFVAEEVRAAFGAAFRLEWIDATSGTYRVRRSLAGRKAWRADVALARERAAAEADPAVVSARRFFPNSKVVDVKLADPAPAGGRPDPA